MELDGAAADIRNSVRIALAGHDPDARVEVRARASGMLELTVVSRRFEALGSAERESLVWPALRDLSPDLLVRMTYSLLITPAEAADLRFCGFEKDAA